MTNLLDPGEPFFWGGDRKFGTFGRRGGTFFEGVPKFEHFWLKRGYFFGGGTENFELLRGYFFEGVTKI